MPGPDNFKYFLLPTGNKSMNLARPVANGSFMRINHLVPINDNCDWLQRLSSRAMPFTHLIQTYILPFCLTLTVIINILLCITLNRPNMRTPTNGILLAISIADLLTGLLPLPIYTAFNTAYFDTDLTPLKGYLAHYCTITFPTLFHTVSIWLAVLLAVQRFIYVVKPLEVQNYAICQYRGVFKGIVIIVGLALSFYVNNFSTTFDPGVVVCTDSLGTITAIHSKLIKCTFLQPTVQFVIILLRAFTVHIIPCLVLCILTAYMMAALRGVAKKRNELLKKRNEMKMLADSIRSANLLENAGDCKSRRRSRRGTFAIGDAYKTSRIMLVVLLLFLIVELPTTVMVVMYGLLVAFEGTPPPFFAELCKVYDKTA
ncbi:hypothetical protein Aperf_G00000067474 [Anoplocephala perfoliata]